MQLSAAELDRLPELMQDIVRADRNMAVIRRGIAKPVVKIDLARFFKSRRAYRQELTQAASRLWGGTLRGDGPATC